jgi:hypothetical protein
MKATAGVIAAAALAFAAAVSGAAPPTATAPISETVSIEAETVDAALDASLPTFVDAVSGALAIRGFTTLDTPGHAVLIASLRLSRVRVGSASTRITTPGPLVAGGAPASVGARVSFALPNGKTRLAPLQRTRLDFRIRKRGQSGIVWQGAAITVRTAGSREGQDAVIAADLIQAILRDYPKPQENVIGVP